jgi:hypothetical protein
MDWRSKADYAALAAWQSSIIPGRKKIKTKQNVLKILEIGQKTS